MKTFLRSLLVAVASVAAIVAVSIGACGDGSRPGTSVATPASSSED
ncbi:MAG: hypothetical protein ABI520_16230 [Caldimonas sp.]